MLLNKVWSRSGGSGLAAHQELSRSRMESLALAAVRLSVTIRSRRSGRLRVQGKTSTGVEGYQHRR
eukprot:6184749-Pleurochrysis_carterae.AAC.1